MQANSFIPATYCAEANAQCDKLGRCARSQVSVCEFVSVWKMGRYDESIIGQEAFVGAREKAGSRELKSVFCV